MQSILNDTIKCEICSSINIKRNKSQYELVCIDCGNVIEYDNIDVGQINAERMLIHHQELNGLKATTIGNLSEQYKSKAGRKLARLQQLFSQEYKNVVNVDSYYFIKKYSNQLGIEQFAPNILNVFKKAYLNLRKRSRCKNIELFSLITIYRCREYFGYSVALEDVIRLYAMDDERKAVRFKRTLSETYGAFIGQDIISGVKDLIKKICQSLGYSKKIVVLSYSLFLSNYVKLNLSNISNIAVSCVYLACLTVPEAGPCMLRDLELACSKFSQNSEPIEAKNLIASLCGSEIWNEVNLSEANRWTIGRELRNRLLNNQCDSRVFAKFSEIYNIIDKISSTMAKLYNLNNFSDRAKFILHRYRKYLTETTPSISAFLSYIIALYSLPEDDLYQQRLSTKHAPNKIPELYKLCEIFKVTPSSVYKILRTAINKILCCNPPILRMSELKNKLPLLQKIITTEYTSMKSGNDPNELSLDMFQNKKYRIYVNYFVEDVLKSKEEFFAVHGSTFRTSLSFDTTKQVLQRILVDSSEYVLNKMLVIPSIDKDVSVNVYIMPVKYKVSVLNTPNLEILPTTCEVSSGTTLKFSFRCKNPNLFIKSITINNKRTPMTNTRTDKYDESIQINAPTTISAEVSKVHIIKINPSNHGEIIVNNREGFDGDMIKGIVKADSGYQIQNLKFITPSKTLYVILDGVLQEKELNLDHSISIQRDDKYLQRLYFKYTLNSNIRIEADFVYQKVNILVAVYLYLNRTEKFLQGSIVQASISQIIHFLYNIDPKTISLINIQGKKYSNPEDISKICSGFSFTVKNTNAITIRVSYPTNAIPELTLGEININPDGENNNLAMDFENRDEIIRDILVF